MMLDTTHYLQVESVIDKFIQIEGKFLKCTGAKLVGSGKPLIALFFDKRTKVVFRSEKLTFAKDDELDEIPLVAKSRVPSNLLLSIKSKYSKRKLIRDWSMAEIWLLEEYVVEDLIPLLNRSKESIIEKSKEMEKGYAKEKVAFIRDQFRKKNPDRGLWTDQERRVIKDCSIKDSMYILNRSEYMIKRELKKLGLNK